jgi:hypothetical protein
VGAVESWRISLSGHRDCHTGGGRSETNLAAGVLDELDDQRHAVVEPPPMSFSDS